MLTASASLPLCGAILKFPLIVKCGSILRDFYGPISAQVYLLLDNNRLHNL